MESCLFSLKLFKIAFTEHLNIDLIKIPTYQFVVMCIFFAKRQLRGKVLKVLTPGRNNVFMISLSFLILVFLLIFVE